MDGLENHYRDMCDIEFTIERDELYILQTRAGKRTAAAAVKMAVAMVGEVSSTGRPQSHESSPPLWNNCTGPDSPIESTCPPCWWPGWPSPGAATGAVVFSSDEAVEQARNGIDVILVRPETTPDDIHGMAAAIGILTSQGARRLTPPSSPVAWASRP